MRRMWMRLGLAFALISASNVALSVYNANMAGVVASVLTYTDVDYVLFRLENQPTSHPSCNANYFAVSADIPADRRKAILSRLLVAKATGESINIGYDSTGSCAHGYIQAHRIG